MLKKIVAFLVLGFLIESAAAFEVRARALEITASGVGTVELRNRFDRPIIVRVQVPEGIQAFPRRFQLLPGDRQTVKARGEPGPDDYMRFSYASQREATGSHARLTLRIPIREVGDAGS